MAKYDPAATKTKNTYAYPSRYGSHQSMVVSINDNVALCKDEYGEYQTELYRLDNGSADPNRFDLPHRGVML